MAVGEAQLVSVAPQAPHPPLSTSHWSSARVFLHPQAASSPSAPLLPLCRMLDGSGATPAMELGESPDMQPVIVSNPTPTLYIPGQHPRPEGRRAQGSPEEQPGA